MAIGPGRFLLARSKEAKDSVKRLIDDVMALGGDPEEVDVRMASPNADLCCAGAIPLWCNLFMTIEQLANVHHARPFRTTLR